MLKPWTWHNHITHWMNLSCNFFLLCLSTWGILLFVWIFLCLASPLHYKVDPSSIEPTLSSFSELSTNHSIESFQVMLGPPTSSQVHPSHLIYPPHPSDHARVHPSTPWRSMCLNSSRGKSIHSPQSTQSSQVRSTHLNMHDYAQFIKFHLTMPKCTQQCAQGVCWMCSQ